MKTIHLAAVTSILALAATTVLAAPCQPFSNFGPDGTTLGNVLTCSDSGGGGTVTITGPGNGFEVLNAGTDWATGFPTGDALLWDNDTAGAVTINFSSVINTTSGLAIDSDVFGAYTATLTAYLDGVEVGSENVSGTSGASLVPAFNFTDAGGYNEIVLSTTNDAEGFAIGFVPVPEPATWAMMLAGMFGLGGMMRSRRRTVAATV